MLQVGNHQLQSAVILAPMSGVTDRPFRKIVRKFGAPMVVTEMIASRAMIAQTRQSMQKSSFDQENGLTAVQLAGCQPQVMAEAAKLCEDLGAQVIDMNFGCPAKKVVNGYAGSALMRDEKKAAAIIKATVEAVRVPVTLKMRLGWDESSKNAPTLAAIAEDLGVQMITVHGRTRSQFYSGNADWNYISEVKQRTRLPLIVNGDIKSYDDVKDALAASGADGVMIGRGCYGRPWLIQQIVDCLEHGQSSLIIDNRDKYLTIIEHYEDMLSYYGKECGVMMARKHLGWYSVGLQGATKFRCAINRMTDPQQVIQEIAALLDQG